MNVQQNINKLLVALKLKGYEYFIDTRQFYSEKFNKRCIKYILHDGNPREGTEFYSKVKLLKHLAFLYEQISGDTS